MDQEIKNRLDKQDELLQKIYISAEKTRKYILATVIVTVVLFVLPLIGLAIVIPGYINQLTNLTAGL
jgi:type IV secretory pathway component VirB8